MADAPGALQRPVAPPPTEHQIKKASELCSQLHYAFYARPPEEDVVARKRWYAYFIDTIYRLSVILQTCTFTDLPMVAVSSIYRANLRAKLGAQVVDLETIHPEGAAAPDIEPPSGLPRLPYNPTNTGQVPLKLLVNVKRTWWIDTDRPTAPHATAAGAVAAQAPPGPSASGDQSAPKPLKSALKTPSAIRSAQDFAKRAQPPQLSAEPPQASGADRPGDPDIMDVDKPARDSKGKARASPTAAMDVDAGDTSDRKRKRRRSSSSVPPPTTEGTERGRTMEKLEGTRRRTRSNSVPAPPAEPDEAVPPNKRKKTKALPYVPPEDGFEPVRIPNEWMEQVQVCARCAAVDGICVFWVFGSSVCHRCSVSRVTCTNTIGANNTKKPIPMYLQWCFQRQLADPAKFPTPVRIPPEWVGFKKDVPTWFAEQWMKYKSSKPAPPNYDALLAARAAAGRPRPSARAATQGVARKKAFSRTVQPTPGPSTSVVKSSVPPSTPAKRPSTVSAADSAASALPAAPRYGPDTHDKGYTEISDEEHSEPVVQDLRSASATTPAPQPKPRRHVSSQYKDVIDLTGSNHAAEKPLSVAAPADATRPSSSSNGDRTRATKPLQSIPVPQAAHEAPIAGSSTDKGTTATTSKSTKKERVQEREQRIIPKRVEGSWRQLPVLARPPSPTRYGQAAGPVVDFRPDNLADFMAIRLAESSKHLVGELTRVAPFASISRPATPPAQVFQLGASTRQVLYDGQHKAWVATHIQEAATTVSNNLRSLMTRLDTRQASLAVVGYAASSSEAIAEVLSTTAGLIDDNKTIANALCAVADVGHLIARALEGVAAITPQFGAVSELVEVLSQLRELYGEVTGKFEELHTEVQVLSRAVEELQDHTLQDKTTVRTLADACSHAVEPMLQSLHYRLQHEIDTIKEAITPLRHATSVLESEALKTDSRLSAEDPGLHNDLHTTVDHAALTAALEEVRQRLTALEDSKTLQDRTSLPSPTTSDTSTIPARALNTVAIETAEDLRVMVAQLVKAKGFGAEVTELATAADLRTAVAELATVADLRTAVAERATAEDLRTAVAELATVADLRTAVAERATAEDLRIAVAELSARLDRLEATQQPQDPTAFGKQVQAYFDSLGLPAPLWLVLSQLVGAHADQQTG